MTWKMKDSLRKMYLAILCPAAFEKNYIIPNIAHFQNSAWQENKNSLQKQKYDMKIHCFLHISKF